MTRNKCSTFTLPMPSSRSCAGESGSHTDQVVTSFLVLTLPIPSSRASTKRKRFGACKKPRRPLNYNSCAVARSCAVGRCHGVRFHQAAPPSPASLASARTSTSAPSLSSSSLFIGAKHVDRRHQPFSVHVLVGRHHIYQRDWLCILHIHIHSTSVRSSLTSSFSSSFFSCHLSLHPVPDSENSRCVTSYGFVWRRVQRLAFSQFRVETAPLLVGHRTGIGTTPRNRYALPQVYYV